MKIKDSIFIYIHSNILENKQLECKERIAQRKGVIKPGQKLLEQGKLLNLKYQIKIESTRQDDA